MIELRVLSGAREGAREQFKKSVVAVGRHPLSDMRFDPNEDLDVSTRHAELRGVNDTWLVYDLESTNGTFVNGVRVSGNRELRDGDVLSFGINGPKAEVRIVPETLNVVTPQTAMRAIPEGMPLRLSPTPRSSETVPEPRKTMPGRVDTSIRVAEAVKVQTASMRRTYLSVGAVLVAGVVAGAIWMQQRSSLREREFEAMLARSESTATQMERLIRDLAPRDSAAARQLSERTAESRRAAAEGRRAAQSGEQGAGSIALFKQRLDSDVQVQQSLTQLNAVSVRERNDAAVGMIASDLDGTIIAGTAFGVMKNGLLVTNKHVVVTEAGVPSKRISVIFANTTAWLPAHVVRVGTDDDLALIQIDAPGTYPVVAGVSRVGGQAKVGSPVMSIGYPHAVDTPMEGKGLDITARSSIAMGTVSKRLADVLQMDSYAGHGSSGSPVFDAQSNVVGVIYGGAPESNGRIVYAVPAERLAAFIRGDASAILR